MLNEFFVGSSGSSAYTVERSLLLNPNWAAYLYRTPSVIGNRSTFTFSCWLKQADLAPSGKRTIFSAGDNISRGQCLLEWDGFYRQFWFRSSAAGGTMSAAAYTQALFRDPSAWYHLVLSIDTTAAASADRIKIYVNGESQSFITYSCPQNGICAINDTVPHWIGRSTASNHHYLGGYLAEVNFVDSQALSASEFAELDDYNNWVPKRFTGHGTNGFKLDFSNSTNSGFGIDSSGQGNNFTTNGSIASHGCIDSPSNYESTSGNNGGNYCTLNPLANNSLDLSHGNLEFTNNYSGWGNVAGTMAVSSGKWYWEYTVNGNGTGIGIHPAEAHLRSSYRRPGEYVQGYTWWMDRNQKWSNGNASIYGGYASNNDVIGVRLDLDNGTIAFSRNGSDLGIAYSGISGRYTPIIGSVINSGLSGGIVNFGQRPYVYPPGATGGPPSDYKSLCTFNLPEPLVPDGSKAVDATTYSGNGSTNHSISTPHQPDLVWIKNRTSSTHHQLTDAVRGVGLHLQPNQVNPNTSSNNRVWQLNSNGFTLGTDNDCNGNGYQYVAWTWSADDGEPPNMTYNVSVFGGKFRFNSFNQGGPDLTLLEGGTYVFDQSDSSNNNHPLRFGTSPNGTNYTTGVTHTGTPGQAGAKTTLVLAAGAPIIYYSCANHSGMGGAIYTNTEGGVTHLSPNFQAKIKADPAKGFSIVRYVGNGTWAPCPHGLGQAPEMIFVKNENSYTNWAVYHKGLPSANDYLNLNYSNSYSGSFYYWGGTAPTNEGFYLSYGSEVNSTNSNHMAYCWAPIEGYSASFKYFGNGNGGYPHADGPFVALGFRPRVILIKCSDGYENWILFDTERSPDNPAEKWLMPNEYYSEYSGANREIDILSNGFKVRCNTGALNTYNKTYIGFAWAEHPFKTARGA